MTFSQKENNTTWKSIFTQKNESYWKWKWKSHNKEKSWEEKNGGVLRVLYYVFIDIIHFNKDCGKSKMYTVTQMHHWITKQGVTLNKPMNYIKLNHKSTPLILKGVIKLKSR